MFTLNKAILIGNIAKDAENRTTGQNLNITNFSLATSHSYKGKDGEYVNETTWHNIVSFNLSEFKKAKLVKGAKVAVEGRITQNNFTDKAGVKRYNIYIVADNIILLEKSHYDVEKNEVEIPKDEDDCLPF